MPAGRGSFQHVGSELFRIMAGINIVHRSFQKRRAGDGRRHRGQYIVEAFVTQGGVMTIALFLHVMSDVIWIGGMFLAYVAVRPAAMEVLEPPQRLQLWLGIFRRFFPWVWGAVIVLLATGFFLMSRLGAVPNFVIIMTVIGILMSAIFMHIYFAPFGRLKRAVA